MYNEHEPDEQGTTDENMEGKKMTKEELVTKMGNEDRANWVMEELLRNVKPALIETILRGDVKKQDALIKEREQNGYYLTFSDLDAPEDFNYWSYVSAVENGEDKDGSKREVLDRYHMIDGRMMQKESDRQASNFYHNMLVSFLTH